MIKISVFSALMFLMTACSSTTLRNPASLGSNNGLDNGHSIYSREQIKQLVDFKMIKESSIVNVDENIFNNLAQQRAAYASVDPVLLTCGVVACVFVYKAVFCSSFPDNLRCKVGY